MSMSISPLHLPVDAELPPAVVERLHSLPLIDYAGVDIVLTREFRLSFSLELSPLSSFWSLPQ
jgi:hypothetical protein